jgi:hypothetical protein
MSLELKRHPLIERLAGRGLLATGVPGAEEPLPAGWPQAGEPEQVALLRLCHAGALEGGLTVALDVRPDELFGPLCQRMGGAALTVKVVDVRERPVLTLDIAWRELEERWELERLEQLPEFLTSLLAEADDVRPVAILGEWEDALQLWCVPRRELKWLVRGPLAAAWNLEQLARLWRARPSTLPDAEGRVQGGPRVEGGGARVEIEVGPELFQPELPTLASRHDPGWGLGVDAAEEEDGTGDRPDQ